MKETLSRLGKWLWDLLDNSANEFVDCFFQKNWTGMLRSMGKLTLLSMVFALAVVDIALVIRLLWPWIVVIPAAIGVAVWKGDAILEWMRKSFHDWYAKSKRPCNRCAGCVNYYPQIRQDVYSALMQCADILELKVPMTVGMIEAPPPQQPLDGITRFFFRLQKTRQETAISLPAIRACLQEALSDAFQNSFPFYAPCHIQGLYLEKVELRNIYSYSICVIPVCRATNEYIQKREAQGDDPAPKDEETVYDDEF